MLLLLFLRSFPFPISQSHTWSGSSLRVSSHIELAPTALRLHGEPKKLLTVLRFLEFLRPMLLMIVFELELMLRVSPRTCNAFSSSSIIIVSKK